MRRIIIAATLVLLAACSNKAPVVIDGSSQESFERTAAAARRDLPDADRLDYDRAIKSIAGRRFAHRDPDTAARVTFDGMTARQIVEDQQTREP